MASPFVAEIRIFGFNFAPRGWAFCNGQLLPISQNTALFSLLGTTYGGDGKSTFGLPNLQGSAPMQQGQGPGLSLRDLGQTGGEQTVTLLDSEMPSHSHGVISTASAGNQNGPGAGVWSKVTIARQPQTSYSDHTNALVGMSPQALSITGSSFPHNNMPPYLTLNFCIALQGVFPARP
jgi:microcystin-dependent protein